MRFHPLALAVVALSACTIPLGGSFPPLIQAARDGDTAALERLLQSGAGPNLRAGVNGWTPLMHAVHKNQPESVKVLLAHGARPNEHGGAGETALIMAAGYGYSDIVRVLLKAGADPSLKAVNGTDALSAAVSGVPDIDRFTVGHCQTDTVRALLTAAPGLKFDMDSIARRIAKFGGCTEVLRLVR
jgi:Ankyrin repeats (3 copies)